MASSDGHVSPGRGDMNAHREECGRVRRAGGRWRTADGGKRDRLAARVFCGETCGRPLN
jgi:hypothetical protein